MLKQHESSAYLDGIRGVAALGVFLNHFSLDFYCAWWTQKPEHSHLNGYEMQFPHSLISFINQGGYFVAIFFVLSGYVLSRKYFLADNIEILVSGLHRRFIRLYIPIAFILIVSYLLMANHLYFNEAVSRISFSDLFSKQWSFLELEERLWYSLTTGAMFSSDPSFDTCLWTISYEFFGSLFVYAFLIFTHFTKRFRLPMMLIAICYFVNVYTPVSSPFYTSFMLGMTLCYTEKWITQKSMPMRTIIAVLLFMVSLLLGSSPFCSPFEGSWQENVKNIWDYTPWCFTIGAYLMVLAFVISPLLQKAGSLLPFRFLGYISFSLYLLHPIIIGSFTSWIFLELYPAYSYNNSVLIAFTTTIPFLLLVSWLMARYVDQFGIRLSHKAYEYIKRPAGKVISKKNAVK